MTNYFLKSLVSLGLLGILSSCEVLEQAPQASLDGETAINDATSAQAAILGAYNALQSANSYGVRLTLLPDLAAGNLTHTGTFPSFAEIANRSVLTNNAEVTNAWNILYDGINRANNVIDRAPGVTDPTFSTKDAVVSEGYFLRAFDYFTLVRLWGGVPLIIKATTVVDASLNAPRATVEEVYKQIEADLDKAIAGLPTSYGTAAAAKGRATKAAAYALKSKVALYQKKWADAADLASKVTGYSLVPTFNSLFEAKNTAESIWELQFDPTNQNTLAFFLFSSTRGGRNETRPSNDLIKTFPAGDTRAITSTSYDSKIKYFRVSTSDDNIVMLRLGEVYLTRAESLNEVGGDANLAEAARLVNLVRVRAGLKELDNATKISQSLLRDEIYLQRRLELALEGGNYWYDLIRTGRASKVLANWNDNQAVWPIPLREINSNPSLKQNPGY